MTLLVAFTFLTFFLLVMFDFLEVTGSQQLHFDDWINLGILHVFLVGPLLWCAILILPDFLLVYTNEGIKWFSFTGYKLIPWSEIYHAEINDTFWRGRRIILTSSHKKLKINCQLFANPDEAIKKIKPHIPKEKWLQVNA